MLSVTAVPAVIPQGNGRVRQVSISVLKKGKLM